MKKMKMMAKSVARWRRCPGWSVKDGKLHREYKFADFPHAFGMMATAAPAIEKMDHHPEWCNVYNRVTVDLSTHDASGGSRRRISIWQSCWKGLLRNSHEDFCLDGERGDLSGAGISRVGGAG